MRISVVTPSFNMGRYLELTIKSVVANLRSGDEYFIVDGGSTDGSLNIIRGYEHRLAGWISEADEGYADAIGKGFAGATGDILCWMNAGDFYLSGALDVARKAFTDDRDMIFGDDFYVDEANRILSFSRGWVPDLRSATLFGGWTPLQDACFWRRSLYEAVGGINRSLRYAADYDLFLRMAQTGRTAYVPLTFSAFRRHSGQKSVSGMKPYQIERQRARARALDADGTSPALKAVYRGFFRIAMSARSRLAPLAWRRRDLVGQSAVDVPSGTYWGTDQRIKPAREGKWL